MDPVERSALICSFGQAILTVSPRGNFVWDDELRFVTVNETAARMNGVPAEDHVGRHVSEILPADLAQEIQHILEDVRRSGEPRLRQRLSGTTAADPEHHRSWECDYYPLLVGTRLAGFACVAVEITERVEALAALDEQGVRIYEEVVQALAAAKMASEIGEDRGFVDDKIEAALTNAKTIIAGQLAHQFEVEIVHRPAPVSKAVPIHDPTRPQRVVLCDDDDAIRMLLHALVDKDEAFEVVGEARNGAECIDLVSDMRPDLVVLDLNMPVMGGLDALPDIRKASEHTAVVVMSAFDSDVAAPEAFARGASAYVEKGTNVSDIVTRLKDVVL